LRCDTHCIAGLIEKFQIAASLFFQKGSGDFFIQCVLTQVRQQLSGKFDAMRAQA
jgi:hypothetical protein